MISQDQVKEFIRSELLPIRSKLEELTKEYKELRKSVQNLSDNYDDLLNQQKEVKRKQLQDHKDISLLKQDVKIIDMRANEALTDLDDLSQYIRRDCVEISGIKPNQDCTPEDIAVAVGVSLGVDINPSSDISTAHVLPSFSRSSPPKIIVKFARRSKKDEIYQKRKHLMKKTVKDLPNLNLSSSNKIYISESLTPKRKKLFGEVNKQRKRLKWKFIWTQNGKIYLKEKEQSKVFTFTTDEDIRKFENEHSCG